MLIYSDWSHINGHFTLQLCFISIFLKLQSCLSACRENWIYVWWPDTYLMMYCLNFDKYLASISFRFCNIFKCFMHFIKRLTSKTETCSVSLPDKAVWISMLSKFLRKFNPILKRFIHFTLVCLIQFWQVWANLESSIP